MMMTRGWLIFGMLACATAPARPADRAAAAAGPRARELFPLAVGNRWSYDVSFLGARQALSVSIVSADGPRFQDSRGQAFIVEPDGLRDEHRYLLKEPLTAGAGWSSIIDVSTTESYKVLEIGVPVDVPAGHFEGCARIEAQNPQGGNQTLIAEQVYCPGVGLVRVVTFQETANQRGPAQFTQELTSYAVHGG